MQFLLSLSSTSWNCSIILSFSVGSQAMTATYVSWYGMIEQISELQYELHNLQHELENVLPHERGRCIDEL
jgi:HAUS augmin-like complex subunit 3